MKCMGPPPYVSVLSFFGMKCLSSVLSFAEITQLSFFFAWKCLKWDIEGLLRLMETLLSSSPTMLGKGRGWGLSRHTRRRALTPERGRWLSSRIHLVQMSYLPPKERDPVLTTCLISLSWLLHEASTSARFYTKPLKASVSVWLLLFRLLRPSDHLWNMPEYAAVFSASLETVFTAAIIQQQRASAHRMCCFNPSNVFTKGNASVGETKTLLLGFRCSTTTHPFVFKSKLSHKENEGGNVWRAKLKSWFWRGLDFFQRAYTWAAFNDKPVLENFPALICMWIWGAYVSPPDSLSNAELRTESSAQAH